MRAGIENWLLGHWYGTHRPPWYLRMLESVYRAGFQHHRKRIRAGADIFKPDLPLIVVGNITAGGSGKTPLVIRLCQLATDLDLKPGIVSTGYGRKSRETLMVNAESDPLLCGDEPVLLAKRTGATVAVAARRRDAVIRLQALGLDLCISDDGLQQADIYRDIDICVVDGVRGLGNGRLIPAGPLREPPDRLAQFDHIITNGEWVEKPPGLDASIMHLKAAVVRSLDDTNEIPLEKFQAAHLDRDTHAVAAIGRPQRFFKMLENTGFKVIPHTFPDHHIFTAGDFTLIVPGETIVMTEKDAVKCRGLGLENAWYIPVDASLAAEFEHIMQDQMKKLTRESKA